MRFLILISALSAAAPVWAQSTTMRGVLSYELSSAELLDYCRERSSPNESAVYQLLCHGYITGVRDGIELGSSQVDKDKRLFCIPKLERERDQVKAVVTDYLQTNPKEADTPAVISVALALKRKFPCSNGPN